MAFSQAHIELPFHTDKLYLHGDCISHNSRDPSTTTRNQKRPHRHLTDTSDGGNSFNEGSSFPVCQVDNEVSHPLSTTCQLDKHAHHY